MESQSVAFVSVEHNGQRILTTDVIAQKLGTPPAKLLRNFQRNLGRYIEGKHYYRLEGDSLRQFKEEYPEIFGRSPDELDDNLSPSRDGSVDQENFQAVGKRAKVLYRTHISRMTCEMCVRLVSSYSSLYTLVQLLHLLCRV